MASNPTFNSTAPRAEDRVICPSFATKHISLGYQTISCLLKNGVWFSLFERKFEFLNWKISIPILHFFKTKRQHNGEGSRKGRTEGGRRRGGEGGRDGLEGSGSWGERRASPENLVDTGTNYFILWPSYLEITLYPFFFASKLFETSHCLLLYLSKGGVTVTDPLLSHWPTKEDTPNQKQMSEICSLGRGASV